MVVYGVSVFEYEKNWGSKLDDYMVCLSIVDGNNFIKEFNSKNTLDEAPEWYMVAKGEPSIMNISDKKYNFLTENQLKRAWLSELNKID